MFSLFYAETERVLLSMCFVFCTDQLKRTSVFCPGFFLRTYFARNRDTRPSNTSRPSPSTSCFWSPDHHRSFHIPFPILLILSLELLINMKLYIPLFLAVATTSAFVLPSTPFVAKNTGVSTTNLFMGEVTPKTIKELRDATGAGMMDCKRALLESDGDQEAAADSLRKKGLAKADKKASRIAAEGKIVTSSKDGKAVMVEVNCETDFVAKDGSFLEFCDKVAGAAIGIVGENVEALMGESVDGATLEETRQAMVFKIGENIQVRRLAARGSGDSTVGAYVHMNRIGVLVEIEGGTEALCTDVAMHVAAMNPPFATADQVPADVLEKEKKLLTEQALESGKPAEIVEKMVEGRIRKYLEEICLVSQNYVKDTGMTVGKLLEDNGAKMIGFTRIVVGEGIEKKEDDFAAEVAKMAGGSV